MKKTKLKLIALTITISIFSNSLTAFAHPGKIDSSGGHKDNKNASGLGSYHYHHGMGPHLHPGGVCEFTTNSNNEASVNQGKAHTEQLEKDKGYDQGYNDSLVEKPSTPSSSSSSFSTGYSLGYSKGVQVLNDEKASVTEIAKSNGTKDGYSGSSNQSSSYSDKHKSVYTTQYALSHKEGLDKRNVEISTTKTKGKSLGIEDGYNKITKESLNYEGNYLDEFTGSYKEGYSEGEKNIDADMLKQSIESYISGLKNEEFDELAYTNTHIKDAALESHKEAIDVFNNFLKDVPMLGSSLEDFSLYAKENDKIKIGNTDIDDSTFISINDKSKKKVTGISFFINAIEENGYTKETTSALIESFLSKDFIDSYTTKSSYQRSNDDFTYDIYNLKRNNKISKSAPKKISIITISKDNMVQEVKILNKEPKDIKKYKKIKS